jgi:hypothetical protein
MPPKELTAFRLPPHLLAALRAIKDRDGISMTDQLVRALEVWIESRGFSQRADRKRAVTRRRS